MFDYQKPTIQMLARAPWEKEDTEIFEEAWTQTGQILIQVRDTNNSSYDYSEVRHQIILALRNYKMGVDYEIMKMPNIIGDVDDYCQCKPQPYWSN